MSTILLASFVAGSLALAVFTAVGYPALLRARARGRRSPIDATLASADAARAAGMHVKLPRVTAVVATRDVPSTILERVRDLRAGEYPQDRLEVVVAVDASGPYPASTYATVLGTEARVVVGDAPGGKSAALNAGVRAASGDILLFVDSAQRFAPSVIRDLVTAVHAPGVGAVTGVIAPAADDPLLDRYWQYELRLRRDQAAVHSIICVSGAVYVMRRALWRAMPSRLICDDLFATTQVILQGWRVVICERAIATDPREFTREQHFRRKVRTLTGLVQLCAWTPEILLPWRNAIWIDFVVHKLTRVLLPYLGLIAVICSAWLTLRVANAALLWPAGVAAAVLAAGVAALRPRITRDVAWAIKLSTAPVIALLNAVRGRWEVWQPSAPLPTYATDRSS
ncbi:MAG TPA: glycosyltransferase [Gemmatirosa sp.]